MQTVSKEELKKHNTPDDCWIVIDAKVYDVTKFLKSHPGGELVITDLAGGDVTKQFYELHRRSVLHKFGPKLLVGVLEGATPLGLDAPLTGIPYSENLALHEWHSPYFTESHKRFQKAVKKLFAEHVSPFSENWEKLGRSLSPKLWRTFGDYGYHAASLGPGNHIGQYNPPLGDVPATEFDYFHEQILHVERYQLEGPGVVDGLGTGLIIGLPPIKTFGLACKELQSKVLKECLTGEKRICLAVSEPWAGSDVANVKAEAVKTACGKFYLLNGMKKWITGGLDADYFTSAVRIENKLSFLLVPRIKGVQTKRIKTRYSKAAGTSMVIFEDVRVPVEYLIGKEGYGFKMIMHNFNHERWMISCGCLGSCRGSIRLAFQWLMQRKAFGKALIAQPVLRQYLGEMIYKTEAMQGYLDNITYQLCKMSFSEQNKYLGGPICLLKTYCAKTVQSVMDTAVQIFGGRGLTNHGMGSIIARARGTSQFFGILGGSNEILVDFAIRQAMAKVPKTSRL